jgi:hypothetical protein
MDRKRGDMLRAYRRNQPEEPAVEIGDTVTDFRGDTATLAKLDRANDLGYDGKVTVTWPDGSPGYYYAGVFGLVIRDE